MIEVDIPMKRISPIVYENTRLQTIILPFIVFTSIPVISKIYVRNPSDNIIITRNISLDEIESLCFFQF